MADPILKIALDFTSPDFDIIHQGLRLGYQEDDQQVIVHLTAAWETNKDARVAAWNAQKESDASSRAAEEIELAHRAQEEEEGSLARAEAECEQRESDKKKPKMNPFAVGSSVTDILVHPPSHYMLQKLSTFDYVELWYFTHAGRLDVVKLSNKSQANDTFGISRVDDHLTMCSIALVRASCNVLSDHDLSVPEFLRTKNFFLDHARKAEWPIVHFNILTKFF
ncbi:hypothetical protein JVT61DRAFT_7205 [Boletus reticuloceps]|uniref:Uncharacterized protein n=1 Tax=Boletus reticuloceps TaxID=495285 RepID=A0A8I2YIE9_9AGAM|nr:hypothetical protein JVT61DRAFT_7205 [Boletus reticuloceps]